MNTKALILVLNSSLLVIDFSLLILIIWSNKSCGGLDYEILTSDQKTILSYVSTHCFICALLIDLLTFLRKEAPIKIMKMTQSVSFGLKMFLFSLGSYLSLKDESLSPLELSLLVMSCLGFSYEMLVLLDFIDEAFRIKNQKRFPFIFVPVVTVIFIFMFSNFLGVKVLIQNGEESALVDALSDECRCSYFDEYRALNSVFIYKTNKSIIVDPDISDLKPLESLIGVKYGKCGGREIIINGTRSSISKIILSPSGVDPDFVVVGKVKMSGGISLYKYVNTRTCNYIKSEKTCDYSDLNYD